MSKNEMKIPSSFEIDTKQLFLLLKEQNIKVGKQLNDIKVYSNIISKILSIPVKSFDGDYFISLNEITRICEEEFKHLSKNWKE